MPVATAIPALRLRRLVVNRRCGPRGHSSTKRSRRRCPPATLLASPKWQSGRQKAAISLSHFRICDRSQDPGPRPALRLLRMTKHPFRLQTFRHDFHDSFLLLPLPCMHENSSNWLRSFPPKAQHRPLHTAVVRPWRAKVLDCVEMPPRPLEPQPERSLHRSCPMECCDCAAAMARGSRRARGNTDGRRADTRMDRGPLPPRPFPWRK